MKNEEEIKKTPKDSDITSEPTGQVKCPIFVSKNEIIEQISRAINSATDVKKKAMLAKDLIRQANELLICEYFRDQRAECKICHKIAKVRIEVAQLIIKAGKLKINK